MYFVCSLRLVCPYAFKVHTKYISTSVVLKTIYKLQTKTRNSKQKSNQQIRSSLNERSQTQL